MGRTACTEPQCLYKGALYLYLVSILATFPAHRSLQYFAFILYTVDQYELRSCFLGSFLNGFLNVLLFIDIIFVAFPS